MLYHDDGLVRSLLLRSICTTHAWFSLPCPPVCVLGGNDDQIKHIIEMGAIGPLCDILEVQDAKVIEITLDALDNMLRVGTMYVYPTPNTLTTTLSTTPYRLMHVVYC